MKVRIEFKLFRIFFSIKPKEECLFGRRYGHAGKLILGHNIFIRRIERQKNCKINKYEFFVIEGNQSKVNDDLKRYQENGWEIAGSCDVSYDSERQYTYCVIPLKRKL